MSVPKSPQLSLCMIVRNEATQLEQCIHSVADIVDQIVIVDTGSTDATAALAEALGAEIFHYKWNDHFSDARNFSLSKAKHPWILVLDADERISPEDHQVLLDTIQNAPNEVLGYSLCQRTYTDESHLLNWQPCPPSPQTHGHGGYLEMVMPRLLRRHCEIRFEGRVHELADFSIKRLGGTVGRCSVPIHHYGRLDAQHLAKKFEHYVALGRQKIADDPQDPKAYYELGTQLGEVGQIAAAIETLQDGLKISPDHAEIAIALAGYLLQTGQVKEAHKLCDIRLRAHPDCPTANFMLGILLSEQQNIRGAIEHFKRALQHQPTYSAAAFALAQSYAATGEMEAALKSIDRVCQQIPNHGEALFLKGKYLLALGQAQESIDTMLDAQKQTGPRADIYKQLAVAHYQTGQTDKAHHYLVQAKQTN